MLFVYFLLIDLSIPCSSYILYWLILNYYFLNIFLFLKFSFLLFNVGSHYLLSVFRVFFTNWFGFFDLNNEARLADGGSWKVVLGREQEDEAIVYGAAHDERTL